MAKVDLHIHTTASDGKCTPSEIVRKAAELGLGVIAITDHDTVEGIPAALETAKNYPALRVIPGVELSTDIPKGEIHILGYFIDYTDEEFRASLETMRNSRVERARKMVENLSRLGIRLEWRRVQEIAGGGAFGRPHIAQAMLEKGYISSFQDAFRNYIGHGGPAYVERDKLTPVEAVKLILKADGLPVLAHPLTAGDVEGTIVELKAVGLVGMEVYYASYSFEDINPLRGLAYQHGLIATGGTDYHGIDETAETMIGGADVPARAAEQLVALAVQRGLKAISFR
ncbi:MAG: PHP domain-containing protein [Dehalococcoidales bacterium]|nr:PHP domain-containing protein [Dehalococcoidales bacterium]